MADVERLQRRRAPRAVVDLPAALVSSDGGGPVICVRGRTRDVSRGGCRIVTERALPAASDPIVTLDLADGPPVVARATVLARVREERVWDYRLLFTSIDEEDRARLDGLLSS